MVIIVSAKTKTNEAPRHCGVHKDQAPEIM